MLGTWFRDSECSSIDAFFALDEMRSVLKLKSLKILNQRSPLLRRKFVTKSMACVAFAALCGVKKHTSFVPAFDGFW